MFSSTPEGAPVTVPPSAASSPMMNLTPRDDDGYHGAKVTSIPVTEEPPAEGGVYSVSLA